VEEGNQLKQRLKDVPNREVSEHGWLIRRLRGAEVRSILQYGRAELIDGQEDSLACLLVSGGQVLVQQGLEAYNLDNMIQNEEKNQDFKHILRDIAILLRRKEGRGQSVTERKERSKKVPVIRDAKPPEQDLLQFAAIDPQQKWPRLHVIKRDGRTVDLCIALWRLHSWYTSRL
jgi:hypothetical protein